MRVSEAKTPNPDKKAKTFGKFLHQIFLDENEEAVLSFMSRAPDSVFVIEMLPAAMSGEQQRGSFSGGLPGMAEMKMRVQEYVRKQ